MKPPASRRHPSTWLSHPCFWYFHQIPLALINSSLYIQVQLQGCNLVASSSLFLLLWIPGILLLLSLCIKSYHSRPRLTHSSSRKQLLMPGSRCAVSVPSTPRSMVTLSVCGSLLAARVKQNILITAFTINEFSNCLGICLHVVFSAAVHVKYQGRPGI